MPEQQGDEGQEDVEQVRLDASLVEDAEPGKQPGRKTERRQHGPSSTVSGTWLWKSVFSGKSGISAGGCTCGRSAQPNSPTSIWANDDDVYCMRAVGAA